MQNWKGKINEVGFKKPLEELYFKASHSKSILSVINEAW